jgi:hypothetical protein
MANKIKKPPMNKVESSNISEVGHDDDNNRLFISFKSGKTYYYEEIARWVYNDMMSSPSIGKYFHHEIRSLYGDGTIYTN